MAEAPPAPRLVGGLWCQEVLALLPDLAEESLGAAELDKVAAHLAGCDWCTRFGGRYSDTVARLRGVLAVAAPVEAGVAERLRARLAREREQG